jgi:hypothetical protein
MFPDVVGIDHDFGSWQYVQDAQRITGRFVAGSSIFFSA